MVIRKQNSTKPGSRKEQRSSNSPEENSKRTEETQHGPFQIPSNIRVRQENGNKWNTHIQWNEELLKEVLWCFMYIKEKILGENYKKAFELWRERNPMMRINTDATLFLNQKNCILKAKRITPVEIDETKEDIRLKIWNVQRITQRE